MTGLVNKSYILMFKGLLQLQKNESDLERSKMGGQTKEEANKVNISKMMGLGLGQHV